MDEIAISDVKEGVAVKEGVVEVQYDIGIHWPTIRLLFALVMGWQPFEGYTLHVKPPPSNILSCHLKYIKQLLYQEQKKQKKKKKKNEKRNQRQRKHISEKEKKKEKIKRKRRGKLTIMTSVKFEGWSRSSNKEIT